MAIVVGCILSVRLKYDAIYRRYEVCVSKMNVFSVRRGLFASAKWGIEVEQ